MAKPTIEELEKILEEKDLPIEILPNGEIRVMVCESVIHREEVKKIENMQIHCFSRNDAPSHEIDQFKFCPYCGKNWVPHKL